MLDKELDKKSQEFEKLIGEQLEKQLGMKLEHCDSKEAQDEIGDYETSAGTGVEVKFDNQMEKYHNLYFEVYERTKYMDGTFSEWRKGALAKKNKTTWWVQGNFRYFYVIDKYDIVQWCKEHWKELVDKGYYKKTATSKGIVISEYVVRHEIKAERYEVLYEKEE